MEGKHSLADAVLGCAARERRGERRANFPGSNRQAKLQGAQLPYEYVKNRRPLKEARSQKASSQKKALIGWLSHQGNCFLFPVMFSRKFLPENCSEAPAPVGAPAPIQMTKPGAQPERMDGCGSLAPLSRVLVLEPKATGTSGKNDQLCFPTSCIT